MSRRLAALLAAVVVLSVLAPAGAIGVASGVPGGLQQVPEENVMVDLPRGVIKQLPYSESELKALLEESVYASEHAESLEVTLTLPGYAKQELGDDATVVHGGGPIALLVTDDTNSDGREVTIDRDVIETILGYVPEDVTGTHDSGERWSSQTSVEDGLVVFEVPHFSTNTVTFAETVSLTGTPGDGTSYSYDVLELSSATDPVANITGVTATEWDNKTVSSVDPSGSVDVSVAGNTKPSGPSANGLPLLSLTAPDQDIIMNVVDTLGDGSTDNERKLFGDASGGSTWQSEWTFTAQENRTINQLRLYISTVDSDLTSPSISIVKGENVDNDQVEGTSLGSPILDTTTGWQTLGINSYSLEKGRTYTLQFEYSYNDGDGKSDLFYIATDTSPTSTVGLVEKRDGSSSNSFSEYAKIELKTNKKPPQGVNVTIDGTTYNLGDFTKGETKTKELDLSLAASTLNFTASRSTGVLDVDLDLKERTKTEDPSLSINGNWLNHTGTLNDGETVSLTGNLSWLQDGTNTVTVSLPSLSADAPPPVFELNYSHDVEANKSVDIDLGRWVERYNLSRTYDASRPSSTLKVPLIETASELRNLEYSVNGSAWESVPSGSRTFDGTTITVEVEEITPGSDVPANATVRVRTTAHRFLANNASVKVVNMSGPNEDLDSRIKVETWNADSYLAVGGSSGPGPLKYVYNAEWEEEPYVTVDSSGDQRIYLPKAEEGLKTWVQTIPVEVNVKSGDVRIGVEESGKPLVLDVGPGSSGPGDTVTFRYTATTSGAEYILWSVADQIVRDSAVASSPVLLEDDDSDEDLKIYAPEDDSSSSGDDGGGGPIGIGGGSGVPIVGDLTLPLAILAGGIALVGLLFVGRRTGTFEDVDSRVLVGVALGLLAVIGIGTGAIPVPDAAGLLVIVAAVSIAGLVALQLTGSYTRLRWLVIVAGAVLLALTQSDAGLISGLVAGLQPAIPIIIVAAAGLGYVYLRNRGETNKIIFRGGGS